MISYDQLIETIAYRLELLRSTFIEIDAIFGEIRLSTDDISQLEAGRRIKSDLEKGLRVCSETFGII